MVLFFSIYGIINHQMSFMRCIQGVTQDKVTQWTKMNPITSPQARTSPTMAYDVESDRMIYCGGDYGYNVLTDVWAYDYNTDSWIKMKSPGYGRFEGDMVYDEESDRVILFGGFNSTDSRELSDNTFAYDYNTDNWENLTETMTGSYPAPRVTRLA